MGCLSSKPDSVKAATGGNAGAGQPAPLSALDRLPDFGLADQYEVRELLGEGGSGQTWLCRDVEKKKMVAIKFIKRAIPRIVLPMLMHEIKIQAELGDGHVNLVSAMAVVLTDTHLGIVMEYASGGNLTNYVTDKWELSAQRDGLFLTEDEARYFFRQYINAVEFLHSNHVAHRDLKLDNIVLDGSTPPRIKVCDFGFAKNWDSEANMFTQIGTPVYMCPQLISCKQNSVPYDATKADIWACGVLLFVMLLGMFPYDHTDHPDPNSSDAHMEVWMQQRKYNWRESPTVVEGARKLSLECQDLLDKMFERDEGRRITIERIKAHRWFRKAVPAELQKALDSISEEQGDRESKMDRANRSMGASRNKELLEMLEEAGNLSSSPSQFKRIDLTWSALVDSSPKATATPEATPAAEAAGGEGAGPAEPPAAANHDGSAENNHAAGSSPASGSSPAPAATPPAAPLQNGRSGPSDPGSAGAAAATPGAKVVAAAEHALGSEDIALTVSSGTTAPAAAVKEEPCAQAVISDVPSIKAVAVSNLPVAT